MQVALVGLGVMGKNLALNLIEKGITLVAYDKNPNAGEELLSCAKSQGMADKLHIVSDLGDMVRRLEAPRSILLLVPAGELVDAVCNELIEAGVQCSDIIVDCGNSNYKDGINRKLKYQDKFEFATMGISGGAEGARHGPAMMASGSEGGWERVEPWFTKVAASYKGESCFARVGQSASGHFVKMVHNGIEYALMQLIAEMYQLLRHGTNRSPKEIAEIFNEWSQGQLNSYLLSISSHILSLENSHNVPLVDLIDNKVGAKGTGLWTAQNALELGIAVPSLVAAVQARHLTNACNTTAAQEMTYSAQNTTQVDIDLDELKDAFTLASLLAYRQGLALIKGASRTHQWKVDLAKTLQTWRAGCIIRADYLDSVAQGVEFIDTLEQESLAMRKVTGQAVMTGLAFPVLSATQTYLATLTTPSNGHLVQAQRDYFGEHGIKTHSGETCHLTDLVDIDAKVR
ncbi:6-phosphogluconate dehydrogenase, decarboxylating [Pseudoalteromonas issachenkonii]|jgi:6-phosphogluconate dehydrogenase|uniref:6-phosphogluconate dehydrogenase, decarboxylating n=1 Tax=Pseudoalteromonas issachenkonii TaxID=152297 RepID=A0ABM6N2V5_9GAMM|nr:MULTISPECIES: NADP-dependent phosphogluconate dehydrogenase [Pseudoalteromonas]MAY60531.1 NADP-dependent phosphogluconate dehydrogenase [Pseudoalteromonas sp.]ALQ54703.1 6-phosphogluconate dehydrogenase, decarboxylating [Pseudoalteromonas issachenkonii]ATC90512.1 6-phosphogluconate dehydrogenase [Pseudoalteromonas issachenkonii]MDN3403881.1 NADP-dependent phosphogluconate dehydrogenase [Pseudoalteromonas sp. APC 3218]MDN3410142.1 NADP-dependent phosphogluconate dehydrogenase [Pseudoalteromo|tara:strand:- start:9134 stop:10507 length:1374 start_codon:yes stop_codon:yes gene_type:complete